jgi:large subunit ribosomal protein L13
MPRPADIVMRWWVLDATDMPLGRLASRVATVLRGKHRPDFAPHMDMGDHVVVVNAERVAMSGHKLEDRVKTRYTGWPGGGRSVTWERMMQKHPERVVELAVWGMLPKNRLGRKLVKKLKVYRGPAHPHEAQAPQALDIGVARRVNLESAP